MKKDMNKQINKDINNDIPEVISTELQQKEEKLIGRKEAIKKAGLVALSAATMMILVGKPNKAVALSTGPENPPDDPW